MQQPSAPLSLHLLTPCGNSALFLVQPGVSFHSVQEVMNVDKKRVSIQGWFHGAAPPPGSDVATIAQLTTARALNAEAAVFTALSPSHGSLAAEDYESLSEFVSVDYLKPHIVKQLRREFDREGSVQLRNFIRSEYADKFRESVRCSDLLPLLFDNSSAPCLWLHRLISCTQTPNYLFFDGAKHLSFCRTQCNYVTD